MRRCSKPYNKCQIAPASFNSNSDDGCMMQLLTEAVSCLRTCMSNGKASSHKTYAEDPSHVAKFDSHCTHFGWALVATVLICLKASFMWHRMSTRARGQAKRLYLNLYACCNAVHVTMHHLLPRTTCYSAVPVRMQYHGTWPVASIGPSLQAGSAVVLLPVPGGIVGLIP